MSWTWEHQALRGEPCPSDMREVQEICAYEAMSHLYARYNMGQISKEQAVEEKRRIVDAYSRSTKRIREHDEVLRKEISFFHNAESAVIRFNKARTYEEKVEAAEEFIAILYGHGHSVSQRVPLRWRDGDKTEIAAAPAANG